jgi:cytoskeletal protein CcmA (bactofilin family)
MMRSGEGRRSSMFSRSKAQPRSGKGRDTYSFVGPEVIVTGDIASPGQLHVDGKVTGDVRCGTLSQGESGAITGNIDAEEARLAGLIDGAVSAGTLLLEATARITGDVLYGTLTVATGAQVDGRFKHRTGESDGSNKARTAAPPANARPVQPAAVQPAGLFTGSVAEPTAEAAE